MDKYVQRKAEKNKLPTRNQLIRKLDKLREKISNLDNSIPNYKDIWENFK